MYGTGPGRRRRPKHGRRRRPSVCVMRASSEDNRTKPPKLKTKSIMDGRGEHDVRNTVIQLCTMRKKPTKNVKCIDITQLNDSCLHSAVPASCLLRSPSNQSLFAIVRVAAHHNIAGGVPSPFLSQFMHC